MPSLRRDFQDPRTEQMRKLRPSRGSDVSKATDTSSSSSSCTLTPTQVFRLLGWFTFLAWQLDVAGRRPISRVVSSVVGEELK